MAIKQIQLRGISREPSDRMTKDGGLAESLNVQLQEGETVPQCLPRDVTEALLGDGASVDGTIVLIHKGTSYTHYIELYEDKVYAWIEGTRGQIGTVSGTFVDACSLGNTIIITTEGHAFYFLFKDGDYLALGETAPDPGLEFIVGTPGTDAELSKTVSHPTSVPSTSPIYQFDATTWNKVLNSPDAGLTDTEKTYKSQALEYIQDAWDAASAMAALNRTKGYFFCPILARYAVRLYDGTYVNLCQPVMLGGTARNSYSFMGVHAITPTSFIRVQLDNVFKASVAFSGAGDTFGNWKDLILSVDVFLSEDIDNPMFNSPAKSVTVQTTNPTRASIGFSHATLTDFKERILAASNFYKVASFSVDELEAMRTAGTTYDLLSDVDMGLQEYRVTQERLQENTVYGYVPHAAMQYNGRLVAKGANYHLPEGYRWLPAPVKVAVSNTEPPSSSTHSNPKWHLRYFIRDEGSVYTVDVKNISGGTEIISHSPGSLCGMIFYPDRRCYKLVIYTTSRVNPTRYEVKMNPHPNLNCAYGSLLLYSSETFSPVTASSTDVQGPEKPVVPSPNKLLETTLSSFVVYDLASVLTLNEDIIDVATTTKALSTGQFGQFPLYVFTAGGVFAVSLSAAGTFAACHPVSRDVAIAGTVHPIDQAIVFTTERGVMLLQDSSINDISPYMQGRHYTLDTPVATLLGSDTDFAALLPATTDDAPFMAFMKEAKAAYDYCGQRLIFFKDEEDYQYVYMLGTSTWHKTIAIDGNHFSILNSYPDCLISSFLIHDVTVYDLTIESLTMQYLSNDREWLADVIHTHLGDSISEDAAYYALAQLPCTLEAEDVTPQSGQDLDGLYDSLTLQGHINFELDIRVTVKITDCSDYANVASLLDAYNFGDYDEILELLYDGAYYPLMFSSDYFEWGYQGLDYDREYQDFITAIDALNVTYTIYSEYAVLKIFEVDGAEYPTSEIAAALVAAGVCSSAEATAALNALPHTFTGIRMTASAESTLEEALDTYSTDYGVVEREETAREDCSLIDCSTIIDDADYLSDTTHPVKGLIVTRPFDLGEPDIRKAIRNLRIRGQFNRQDVKYILLGSMDGHSWKILPSLRGGSYKLFRLVILTKLSPTERLSWVDIDYETRFTNRLR